MQIIELIFNIKEEQKGIQIKEKEKIQLSCCRKIDNGK